MSTDTRRPTPVSPGTVIDDRRLADYRRLDIAAFPEYLAGTMDVTDVVNTFCLNPPTHSRCMVAHVVRQTVYRGNGLAAGYPGTDGYRDPGVDVAVFTGPLAMWDATRESDRRCTDPTTGSWASTDVLYSCGCRG